MGDLQTVKVKHEGGYAIINKSDFDPKQHQPYDDEAKEAVKDEGSGSEAIAERDAVRQHEANRGVGGGAGLAQVDKNPSGTFSEPTPTDIRYPDKDATEFENNHGAFVGKSAAGLREEQGLDDQPGGVKPEVAQAIADGKDPVEAQAAADDDPTDGLHVGKGPGGRLYVKNGKERVSGPYGSQDEADKALEDEKAKSAG